MPFAEKENRNESTRTPVTPRVTHTRLPEGRQKLSDEQVCIARAAWTRGRRHESEREDRRDKSACVVAMKTEPDAEGQKVSQPHYQNLGDLKPTCTVDVHVQTKAGTDARARETKE